MNHQNFNLGKKKKSQSVCIFNYLKALIIYSLWREKKVHTASFKNIQ